MIAVRIRLAVALVLAAGVVGATADPAMAEDSVPYQDFSASGSVGLCDQDGKPVTSGKITDKPFVWFAASSMPAPAGYDGKGRKATLVIFQPRPKTYPPQWNGDQLTSSSPYTNPEVPMAAASARDFSLADFISAYKPIYDGYFQLRMYFGIPGKATYTEAYPATDIKVEGDTWRVVRGESVPCDRGTAVPDEQPGPTPAAAASTSPRGTSSAAAGDPSPSAGGSGTSGSSPGAGAGTGSGVVEDTEVAPVAQAQPSSGGSSRTLLVIAALGVVALLVALAWWYRRSSSAPRS